MKSVRALMTLLSVAASAQAQRSVHFGVGGGASIPVGRFGQSYRTGAAWQATLIAGAPESLLGVRIDYGYNSFKARPEAPDSLTDTHFSSLTGDVILTIPVGKMKPYGMVGGGWYPYREGSEKTKGNDFGVNGGAGLAFPLFGANMFVEIRYDRVLKRTIADRYVPVMAGIIL